MPFWSELKRRNVVKVAIAYLIVAWLILQIVSIVFPMLNLPSWAGTFVTVLLIIGFPLVLIFAWAFEITPEGLKRTHEVPHHESITHITGQKINYIVTALLVVVMIFVLFKVNTNDHDVIESDLVPAETEETPKSVDEDVSTKTIAVLPFADLSPEKDQEYFADGMSEEILNSLAQISDLTVIARTSSFIFKGSNKKIQEIASELGVAHILEGSVRKAGNALRITAQLVKAVDGSHLWSETYDRELKDVEDILSIQGDIAKNVANELKVKLGVEESFGQTGGTYNEKAYELYMIAKGQMRVGSDTINRAQESIDAAIALDPEFALAWVLKSDIYSVLPVPEHKEVALKAVQKAIELEPNLAVAYASLGLSKADMGDWVEAEVAFRKAREMINESSSRYEIEFKQSNFYILVGYIEMAQEIFERYLRIDPLNEAGRNSYIASLGLFSDTQRIKEEYEFGRALYGNQWAMSSEVGRCISWSRLCIGSVVSRDDLPYSSPIFDTAKEYLDSPKKGLSELRLIFKSGINISITDLMEISVWAAYFGDSEFAMDAVEQGGNLGTMGLLSIWSPVMYEVRQLPRFKELVRKLGLVDFWNKFGWPDLCKPTDDGDFECD